MLQKHDMLLIPNVSFVSLSENFVPFFHASGPELATGVQAYPAKISNQNQKSHIYHIKLSNWSLLPFNYERKVK